MTQSLSLINAPINFDIGLPALGLKVNGNVQAQLSFNWALSFGISTDSGVGFFPGHLAGQLAVGRTDDRLGAGL